MSSKVMAASVTMVAIAAGSGCSPQGGTSGTESSSQVAGSECVPRFESSVGTNFRAIGYADLDPASPSLGRYVKLLSCIDPATPPSSDMRDEAGGDVELFAVPGFAASEVVSAPFDDDGTFVVFAAASIGQAEAERILRSLPADR